MSPVFAIILKCCAVGMAPLAVFAAAWAMFGDEMRRRKDPRPRCRECGYLMEGAVSLTCPECGRVAVSKAEFTRPKKRIWRGVLAVAMLLFAGNLWCASDRVQSENLGTSLIPTTLLAFLAESGHDSLFPEGELHQAVLKRMPRMWSWQAAILEHRYVWFIDSAKLRSCVRTLPVWPEGAGVAFWLDADLKTPLLGKIMIEVRSHCAHRIHMKTTKEALHTWYPGVGWPAVDSRHAAILSDITGPLEVGKHSVVFEISLRGENGAQHTERCVVDFEVVPKEQPKIENIDSLELQSTILHNMRPLFYVADGKPRCIWYISNPDIRGVDRFYAVVVDVMDGEKRVASVPVGYTLLEEGAGYYRWMTPLLDCLWDTERGAWNDAKSKSLRLIIYDDEAAKLWSRKGIPQSSWVGRFEVPFQQVVDLQ